MLCSDAPHLQVPITEKLSLLGVAGWSGEILFQTRKSSGSIPSVYRGLRFCGPPNIGIGEAEFFGKLSSSARRFSPIFMIES